MSAMEALFTTSFDLQSWSDNLTVSIQKKLEDNVHTCDLPDFIMEPEIFSQLKRYFQAGGNPEQVIELLSINYVAVAQVWTLM